MRKLLIFVLTFIVAAGGFVSPARAQESGDLLARVNNLRAQRGLWAYRSNGALNAAAQSQAQWIVDTGNVSHTRPDGSGPRTRALAAGYPSAQVSENIYGSTGAGVDAAWSFWVNSGIHYAGLVSTNYDEIGVGVARGSWGAAFVLVFGNSGGPPPPAPQAAAPAGGGGGQGAPQAPAAPPSYLLGVDENGNRLHQVQPGDTLGDIALIYGLGWGDIPFLMELNGISSVRDLVAGTVFLVPPRGGTPTPTPDDRPPTETPTPSPIPPSITPFILPTDTPESIIPTAFVPPVATIGAELPPPLSNDAALDATPTPSPTPTTTEPAQAVAFAATVDPLQVAPPPDPLESAVIITPNNRGQQQTWLLIALGVQAVIIIGAGIEFARRAFVKRGHNPRGGGRRP